MADNPQVRIVVDAMGGDYGVPVNIQGALMALEQAKNLTLTLVGDKSTLKKELKSHAAKESDRLEIVHSEEVISMEDPATVVIRRKQNSSIHVGLKLVAEHKGDAFISAGNSGAVMAGALIILGRIADVERPAIVVKLPTAERFCILLDAGANVDCKASHLYQFAEMGNIYAEVIEGIKHPKLGVLSNGSESHKGNEVTREVHAMLQSRKDLNYIGYVEGFDLFAGTADVVICDGFVGNLLLKGAEGLAGTFVRWFRNEIRRDIVGWVGLVLLRRIIHSFKKKFDYQPYGAAPLLGVNGMVMIGHGSSKEIAICNGILTAKRGVEQNFIAKIRQHLEHNRKKGASVEGTS